LLDSHLVPADNYARAALRRDREDLLGTLRSISSTVGRTSLEARGTVSQLKGEMNK
jgi:hypothetical protein